MLHAVITGDLIDSTKIPPAAVTTLFERLEKEIQAIQKKQALVLEVYRGDSFQCLVKAPAQSLRIALLLKTFFRSLHLKALESGSGKKKTITNLPSNLLDARMALSVGLVENLAPRLATSNGAAFQLSGRMLDQIKDSKQHLIIGSADNFHAEWQTESILLDALLARTSALQCQVLHAKLKGHTETEIAKTLKIGQSAVNQRAASGNWNAINAMLKRFEEVYHHA